MGLGAFGKPVMLDAVRQLIQPTSDGAFQLNLDFFEFHASATKSYSKRFVELFGPPRSPDSPIALHSPDGERFANIAASVQRVLEDVLVDLAGRLHRETGLSDLCLGGGVALNGCANSHSSGIRIREGVRPARSRRRGLRARSRVVGGPDFFQTPAPGSSRPPVLGPSRRSPRAGARGERRWPVPGGGRGSGAVSHPGG